MANNSVPDPVLQKDSTSSDYYWNSYAHFGIHEEMLKDEVRTLSYRDSMINNKHLFAGKVVLDVGCGTGILSMFAAQAGASKVYAVDCSDIIHQARQIVSDNNLDHIVECVQGKIEEVEIPEQVDIIISEWMGYFLLYESMMNSVLIARDRFLKDDGLIMPDRANLYFSAIEDAEYKRDKIDFWDNVYGFDFSCIKKVAYQEPLVDTVEEECVVADTCLVRSFDLKTITIEELSFTCEFALKITRNDYVHALLAWFDVEFNDCHKPITFSTGPFSRYTHWKQTVFYIDENLLVCKDESLTGTVDVKPSEKNPRDLDIDIQLDFDGEHATYHKKTEYKLR
eukprot:TRINITY_DN9821_c0_g1_i1.p1 TRINITY_DN9821_c0_g1~~TRINITY_DN9821_c0_g1_i1.p1  ORF type:complete len:350 (-),score=87.52 TRINITY_DN9821_c0_g1_i1:31-1047(-)